MRCFASCIWRHLLIQTRSTTRREFKGLAGLALDEEMNGVVPMHRHPNNAPLTSS